MSRTAPYWHVDAFARRAFEGNQAAVMIFEAWPEDGVMQAIAAENMFAETAFLVRDEGGEADWGLRWFTPGTEIALCGHATLASGHVLLGRDGGERVTFRTRKSGVLEVHRAGEDYALALPAIPTQRGEWAEAAALLGGSTPQETWRNPNGYDLFVYDEAEEVRALDPDMRGLAGLGDNLFICTAPGEETDVISRVFVPGAGVDEDPATGAAHATLTPYWAARLGRDTFTAYQASPRGGHFTCRLDGERVWLTGGCVTLVEGRFSW